MPHTDQVNKMDELYKQASRRAFLGKTGLGLGGVALADMLARDAQAGTPDKGVLGQPHFPAKAKRVIYLFMSGGPSHLDLYDYKPLLKERQGEQLPDSVRGKQRLTGMSGNQSSIPLVGSPFSFKQYGSGGTWFCDQLPHTASIADDLCVVRSMYTEAINHGPGVTFFQTGTQIAGRPSIGAWLSYGLGQENADLPSFVVLITKDKGGQPLGLTFGEVAFCRLDIKVFCCARRRIPSFTWGIQPGLAMKIDDCCWIA